MKFILILTFSLIAFVSCNDKKDKFSRNVESNDPEAKYGNLSKEQCVVYFYKLRDMNRRDGVTISTDYMPQKYTLKWDRQNLDQEIDSEISKVSTIGKEAVFIQVTREKDDRYPSVEKLAELAMETKLFSTCKDYLKSIRSECAPKDKNGLLGPCFQKRFSWYKYFVSEFIVTKSANGVADMSKLTSPSKEEITEISKHPMILNY